jgi:hypothetical protein
MIINILLDGNQIATRLDSTRLACGRWLAFSTYLMDQPVYFVSGSTFEVVVREAEEPHP